MYLYILYDIGAFGGPRDAGNAFKSVTIVALLGAAVWFITGSFSLGSSSEESARVWLTKSEWVLIVSLSLLVVAAIFGELLESEHWKNGYLYRLAKVALLVGVIGELLGDVGVFRSETILQEVEGRSIADAKFKAADAMKRAADAELKSANLLEENMKLEQALTQGHRRGALY